MYRIGWIVPTLVLVVLSPLLGCASADPPPVETSPHPSPVDEGTSTLEPSTPLPTAFPTETPTSVPTDTPTVAPTSVPTDTPTVAPTAAPTVAPTDTPTVTWPPTPIPDDLDQDGFSTDAGDCNDQDETLYPTAPEIPYDGIDQDCDGLDLVDVDTDGFNAVEVGGPDCNDADPFSYPGAAEIPYDDIDQDCLNGDLIDQDGDGEPGVPAGGLDCDDTNAGTSSTGTEYADGEDNDCDGLIDEDLNTTDDDLDGFSEATGDCNDDDLEVYPEAPETPYDGIDQDCSGTDLVDVDEDGQASTEAFGADCNDDNPSIFTGAFEIPYDGIDQDCLSGDLIDVDQDGSPSTQVSGGSDCDDQNPAIQPGAQELPYDGIDQDCSGTDLIDVDGDGVASTQVADGTDCNDQDPAIHPGVPEVCDQLDNNCSGESDENATDALTWYADSDQDQYGNPSVSARACAAPEGMVANNTDCDDAHASVYPTALETCDQLDNDCDGSTDEAVQRTFYQDMDADQYGNPSSSTLACVAPPGYTADNTDCNDTRADIHPDAPETCDLADNDCNDWVDENTQTTYYQDLDGDGFGNPAVSTLACDVPVTFAANSSDCDDTRANVNPDALETCDSLDNNCDSQVDEGVLLTFYQDADGDAYGNASVSTQACRAPQGTVADASDCDDAHNTAYPGATEVCDLLDNDCDTLIDENVKQLFYQDNDQDAFGNADIFVETCEAPTHFVSSATDCDDTRASVYPGAPEACDSLDNDCDTQIDEEVQSTWYVDSDSDLYGDPGQSMLACTAPVGTVASGTDCDDTRASVHPGAAETCDRLDNDCDTQIDEGLPTNTWYPDPDADGYGTSSGATTQCAQPAGSSAVGGDNCPSTANATQSDFDADGVGDACDNCAATANPGQEPGSSSGVGAACDISTNGLLLHLDADHPASWSSRAAPTSTSNSWKDLSGNNNHATVTTSLGYQTGTPGGFMYSRDPADRGTVTIANLPQGNSPFSGEAWFAFHPYSSNCVSVLEWGTPSTNNYRAGLLICSPGTYNPYFVGQGNDYSANVSLRSATLQHVVFTFDGSNLKIYVNGQLVGTTTKSLNVTGKTVYVGVDNTRNGEAFSGTVHAVRVYSRALGASEVTQNFNADKTRFGYGTSSCKMAKTAGKTSSGVYYIQPDSTPPVAAWCDQSMDNGGWTLLLSANGSSTYWGNNSANYKADGPDMPPLGPGDYDYHARAYGNLPTNEVRLCYATTSKCFTFAHNKNMALKSFFTNSISFVLYSQGSYGWANTGSSSAISSYLSALGLTAHATSCYWLGINDVRSISSIGLLGDWNGGCDGSGFPYHDDLAVGVGLQSCYDANSCNNGGSGHAAGQTRGANGVDNSGVFGPWFVFGR